jgi:hypothetical protein
MQVTQKLYIIPNPQEDWDFDKHEYVKVVKYELWVHGKYSEIESIGEVEVTFDVPKTVTYEEVKLAQLEAERTELRANFQMRLTQIEQEIGRYTAIESNLPGVDYDVKF